MNSASLCSLAGRYDNRIPTRFLVPIDCLKIPAQFTFHPWAPYMSKLQYFPFPRSPTLTTSVHKARSGSRLAVSMTGSGKVFYIICLMSLELSGNLQKLKSYCHFKNLDGLDNQRSCLCTCKCTKFHKILRGSLQGVSVPVQNYPHTLWGTCHMSIILHNFQTK